MFLLRDVWVNFMHGAIKGYEVPLFHEWRRDDEIKLYDQIPFLKVKKGFFDYLEDGINKIPDKLLDIVNGKAFERKNNENFEVDCFGVTDGDRILVVEHGPSGTTVKKSRLIIRQEREVLERTEHMVPVDFPYEPLPDYEDDYMEPPNRCMYGLTRHERDKKILLLNGLMLAFGDGDVHKIRYWYTEWKPGSRKEIMGFSGPDLLLRLIDEASEGWSEAHERLLKLVVIGNAYMEVHYDDLVNGDDQVG